MIVLTGGEPMLYQEGALKLINSLPSRCFQIETNGTIEPSGEFRGAVPQFNVSPKLPSSGNIAAHAIQTGVLSVYAHECNSIFKFVIKDQEDWNQMKWVIHDVEIPNYRVWVMPEGRTPREIKKKTLALVPLVKQSGFNLSPRFHVMIWGKKRGV
jgi:organic radical activating enzyme